MCEIDVLVIDFDTRIDTLWVFSLVVVNTRPTLEREKENKQVVNWCVVFFFFIASQWDCWIRWFKFLFFFNYLE